MRQREADRSPELSHYSPQTAEDNRNKLNLCWTVETEKGYWTLKALLTMKKPLSVSHQAKTLVHFVPKNSPIPRQHTHHSLSTHVVRGDVDE